MKRDIYRHILIHVELNASLGHGTETFAFGGESIGSGRDAVKQIAPVGVRDGVEGLAFLLVHQRAGGARNDCAGWVCNRARSAAAIKLSAQRWREQDHETRNGEK